MSSVSTDPIHQDSPLRQYVKQEAAKTAENLQFIRFLNNLWWVGVRLHCFTGWVLLRYNLGERFLPKRVILFSSVMCVLVSQLSRSNLGMVMGVALLIFGVAHRLQIKRRNKRKEQWHSRDDGTSILAGRCPQWVVRKLPWAVVSVAVVEAAVFVLVGAVLILHAVVAPPEPEASIQAYSPYAFGVYIVTVGVALWLQAGKLKRDARHLYLDMRDSEIENQALAAARDRDMEDIEVGSLLAQAGVAQPVQS